MKKKPAKATVGIKNPVTKKKVQAFLKARGWTKKEIKDAVSELWTIC